MSRGRAIQAGDLVKVQGGMVFIGQTGTALEDAPHGCGKIKVHFDGYENVNRIEASRLVVTGRGGIAPQKIDVRPYKISSKLLERQRQEEREKEKRRRAGQLKSKAIAALGRIKMLSDLEQSEDEELTYIESDKRKSLEKRRRRTAFWA